jgi:hypothetical protein
LDGRPSSSNGQPSSPTMSKFVRFVTVWLGVPPCLERFGAGPAGLVGTAPDREREHHPKQHYAALLMTKVFMVSPDAR